MTGLEITLVALGVILIIISFLFTDYQKDRKETIDDGKPVTELWTKKDEEIIRHRMEEVMQDKVEKVIFDAEDQLNHISNEKIMSLHEFSEQILEKINENHREVIFLYNMLNEKQDEMKKLIRFLDKKKADWENSMIQDDASPINPTKEDLKKTSGMEAVKKRSTKTDAVTPKKSNAQQDKTQLKGQVNKPSDPNKAQEVEASDNNRDNILKMRKEGKSIIEISKMLDMGQGEVKLIIDLYNG